MLAGGFAAQHNRVPLNSDILIVLFVASILILLLSRVRCVTFCVLGFLLFNLAGLQVVDGRLDPRYAGDSIVTRVLVDDFPVVNGSSVTFRAKPVGDHRLPERLRLSWFEPPEMPAVGEQWQLEVRLQRPYGRSNPGAFSVEDWMFRERLQAAGYVVSGKRNQRLAASRNDSLLRFRQAFVARVTDNLGTAAPVVAAIGVGTRHLLTRDDWRRYAMTGTSHLMAISGLHIGLAAAAVFALVWPVAGCLGLRGNRLIFATFVAALAATAYAVISGFAVPSQRATLMLGMVAVAFVFRRRPDSARIVALVAVSLFTVNPLALMSPGFCLSFSAVVVLLWYARRYSGHSRRLSDLVPMQLALFFGLMPLTVLLFQRVALLAPLANLIVVPMFSVLTVPLTLASIVLWPICDAASLLLLNIAGLTVQGANWLIGRLAEWPIAEMTIRGVDGVAGPIGLLALLPALWIALPQGWPGRAVALVGVIALLLSRPSAPPDSCFDTHVLDVGQGLAVVVRTASHSLLFDTGASYRSGSSAADQIILPFLRGRGIERLNWLVVSHGDNDHAGGLPTLRDAIEIGQFLVGDGLASDVPRTTSCVAGERWQADGLEFEFMHPRISSGLVGNDSSCVLTITAGNSRLLLTGDIEADAEREILRYAPIESASAVVVPHHGSLTSSTPDFVNRVSASLAIASAGHNNRWGFPKERVRHRWVNSGAEFVDTASAGAVSFRTCAKSGIGRLRRERQHQQRFWHDRL